MKAKVTEIIKTDIVKIGLNLNGGSVISINENVSDILTKDETQIISGKSHEILDVILKATERTENK